MWWTINCRYTQWYNTTSEVLSSEVTHNRTHSVIKSTMVLPLPLKYCQLPVNLQLLHYIDSGHFLTPYLLSTVSAYIVILLYMLSTGYGKFQFIHNGNYSTFEILSTNMTPNIVIPLPLMYFFTVSQDPDYLWNISNFHYHYNNTITFSTSTVWTLGMVQSITLPMKY